MSDSTKKTEGEEIKKIDPNVQIDGKNYTIQKLKFGGQIELASIIAQTLRGMSMGVDSEDSEGEKETKINIDVGSILAQSPEKMVRIVALGLAVSEEVVREFTNTEEVLEALERILMLNPVNSIMGKSTALLRNIKLS